MTKPEMIVSRDRIEKPKSPVIVFKLTDAEKDILRFFKTHYPIVFNSENPLPLARMIHVSMKKVLREHNVKFTSTQFYNALKNWCSRLKYKECIVNNDVRHDLESSPHASQSYVVTSQDQEDAFLAIKYFYQERLHRCISKGIDKLGEPKGFGIKKPSKPFTVEYKKKRS